MGRTRNIHALETLIGLRPARFKNRTIGHHFALMRGPCTELTASWSGTEVLIAFRLGDFLNVANDSNLTRKNVPRETNRCLRMIDEFTTLLTGVIREEHKAMIDALAKGDEIITAGGFLGKVSKLGEAYVGVELATGVEVQMQRSAVVQVLPKGTMK